MNIYYFSTHRLPTKKAHGLQIMKTCEALSSRGARIELIVPERKYVEMRESNPFLYYSIPEIFSVTKLPCFDPTFLYTFTSGLYTPVLIFFFSAKVRSFLRKKSIDQLNDIAYTRDELLLPMLQKYFRNVVWEAHHIPKRVQWYLHFWKKCKKIFTLTHAMKRELEGYSMPNNVLEVLPDAVDMKIFDIPLDKEQARAKLNLPNDKKIVLYTGHLYAWKGIHTFFQAAKISFDEKYILWVIVGATPDEIEKFQSENVKIIEHQPQDKVAVWLKAADALILPNSSQSTSSRLYTSPLKLFEYMASCRPIVASRLPAIQEILDEKSAYFFEADNAVDLKNTVLRAFSDSNNSKTVVARAYERAQEYTWQKRAEKILRALQ